MDVTEARGAPGIADEAAVRGKYKALTGRLIRDGLTITTMESCTSGQVASLLTDTEGASAVLKGAYITYSNEAKTALGVPAETIARYGVYSAETAAAMAEACRRLMRADLGIGVTGSFGNADPANEDSIPGEVYFALSAAANTACFHCTIPPQPSRLFYKLYVSDIIFSNLGTFLDVTCPQMSPRMRRKGER